LLNQDASLAALTRRRLPPVGFVLLTTRETCAIYAFVFPVESSKGGENDSEKATCRAAASTTLRQKRKQGACRCGECQPPGKSRSVDAASFQAMRRTLLKVLPRRSPGLTLAEMSRAVLARLPADLFPGGAKAGWWVKTVQLDLEAKGVIARKKTKPLRLHRS